MKYLKIFILLAIVAYLVHINYKSYYSMRMDKLKAETNSWRTSEQELFNEALMGGAIGIELAMYDFPDGKKKHKVSKAAWRIGIPSLILNQLFFLFLIIFFFYKNKTKYFVFKDMEENEFVCFKYKKYKKNKIRLKDHRETFLIKNEFYVVKSFDEIELKDEKIKKIKS